MKDYNTMIPQPSIINCDVRHQPTINEATDKFSNILINSSNTTTNFITQDDADFIHEKGIINDLGCDKE